jgi:hypothetical protein
MVATYAVIARKSVGPIHFGMSPAAVHAAMGTMPEDCFRRSKNERYETEGYHGGTVQIQYYGDNPSVNFVELVGAGDFVAVFHGIPVFQTKAERLIELFAKYDQFDEGGPEPGYLYIYRKLDIGLWRSAMPESHDDPDGQFFETIAVGAGSYYDAIASVRSRRP